MMKEKFGDEVPLNFPQLFITRKYAKIRFKNRAHHAIFSFPEVKISKILQKTKKINKRDCFCLHFLFHFYGASRTKTDSHDKYMI